MANHRYPSDRFRLVNGHREKICGGCEQWFLYTLTNFYRNGAKPDGMDGQCRACKGAKMRRRSQQLAAERMVRRAMRIAA